MLRLVPIAMILALAAGCEDRLETRYREGVRAGYADGYNKGRLEGHRQGRLEAEKECDSRSSSHGGHSYSGGTVVAEVCGGGGVNVGTQHYSGGKTGCVRVYGDGRVDRY